jgi:hypothetical protein
MPDGTSVNRAGLGSYSSDAALDRLDSRAGKGPDLGRDIGGASCGKQRALVQIWTSYGLGAAPELSSLYVNSAVKL